VRSLEVRAGEIRAAGEAHNLYDLVGSFGGPPVRPGDVRIIALVCLREVRAAEVWPGEARSLGDRAGEDRLIVQTRLREVRAAEVRVGEFCAREDRAGEDRAGELRSPKVGHGEDRAGEVRVG